MRGKLLIIFHRCYLFIYWRVFTNFLSTDGNCARKPSSWGKHPFCTAHSRHIIVVTKMISSTFNFKLSTADFMWILWMQTDAHKLRPIITIATGSNLVLNYKTAVRQRFFGDSSRRRNIVKAKQKHNDWKLFNLVYVEVSAQCLCLFHQVLTSCCKKKKQHIYVTTIPKAVICVGCYVVETTTWCREQGKWHVLEKPVYYIWF